ncbi:MAG: protein kinase [Deltaproteobacteria bacterium]|nr:protein kinase [Deltaproteobacteria bacterium]
MSASTHVGRYELVERLGQGLTCEVHLARTVRRDGEIALVALKRPLPAFEQDPRFVEELLASAHRAEQLLHPGIARVLEVSTDPKTPFVVSEYVHGEQFAAILRRLGPGVRPLDLLLRVIALAAEAVEHAHSGRPALVHASLTPQNVFLAYDGEVRVSDFGAPRLAIGPEDETRRDHGGIAYWSPEQAAERMLDARSDVFSLGAILWECVTQRRLFQAPTRALTRALVRRAEVPLPGDFTDCPAALERIVMRCLARDPNERPATAGVLAEDLHQLLEKRRRDASPAAARKLLQELFAQRQAGRDATIRRAKSPGRDSYAPLPASSPSLPSPAASSSSEPTPTTTPTLTTTSQIATLPEDTTSSQTATLPESVVSAPTLDAPTVEAPIVEASVTKPTPVETAVVPSAPQRSASLPRDARADGSRRVAFAAIAFGVIALLVVVVVRMSTRAEDDAPPMRDRAPTPVERTERTAVAPTEIEGVIDTQEARAVIEEDAVEPERVVEPAVVEEPVVDEAVVDDAVVNEEPVAAAETAAAEIDGGETASLEVVCRPAAEIFLDGRSLGLTPRVVEVPAGSLAIGLRSTSAAHPWRTIRREVEPRGTLSIAMSECP